MASKSALAGVFQSSRGRGFGLCFEQFRQNARDSQGFKFGKSGG